MTRKRIEKTLSTGQTHVINGVPVRIGRVRKRKFGKGQVTLTYPVETKGLTRHIKKA